MGCVAGCPDPSFNKDTITNPTSYSTDMGATVTVTCRDGHYFAQKEHTEKESVVMTCNGDGWDVKQVPQCERKCILIEPPEWYIFKMVHKLSLLGGFGRSARTGGWAVLDGLCV